MWYVIVAIILWASNVLAQGVGPAPGVALRDEGVLQGRIQIIDCTGAGVTCSKTGVTGTINIAGGGGGGYNQIQEEGVNLTQRTTLNFIGTSITCVDNGGTLATDCTVTGGGGSGLTHPEVMSRVSLGF